MLLQDTRIFVNFDAIYRIINRTDNDAEPFGEEKLLLASQEGVEPLSCFPKPPERRNNGSHRNFKIDLSSIHSTVDCVVPNVVTTMNCALHKNANGKENFHATLVAIDHQKALFENIAKENFCLLHSKEQHIERHASQNGSGREIINCTFNRKFSSVDDNLLSLESQRLEEDVLATPILSDCISHVIEKVTAEMTVEVDCAINECDLPGMKEGVLGQYPMHEGFERHRSELNSRELCLEKIPQLDISRQNFEVMPSVMPLDTQSNDADTHMEIAKGSPYGRGTKIKDTCHDHESEDVLNMTKELQSFSQKLNGHSTCSLEQKGNMNLIARNISSSGLKSFSIEESGEKDHPGDMLHSSQLSQIESSSTCFSKNYYADRATDTCKLQVSQKKIARAKTDIYTSDYDKDLLAGTDRKTEHFQDNHRMLLSPVIKSNMSPALKLFRKRRSECHVAAYDPYDPCNASIQQGALQNSSLSISISQGAIELPKDFKHVEGTGECRLSISHSCSSQTHADIKCKKKSKRQNKIKSAMPDCQILKKNESAICINRKERTRKDLNWEDWECLKGAGTSWTSGVRRSLRIRSRPLEFWRGERFLYGRILNCLSTVIGVKYASPEAARESKEKPKRFKVQSYVEEKYSNSVNFAALH